jgi:hypothetical protein
LKWHLLPFLLIVALLAPVSGYRHIWQDEAETAERARSIVAFGVPKTIDPEGRISVNSGGLEIEETDLHRYTPWLQFYSAALGFAIGERVGLSADASVRMPSIVMHGMTSSLISYGLTLALGVSPVASAGLATLFGFQSVRLLHNRSARYHALLDFLFALGMVSFVWARRTGFVITWSGAVAIFLLPQVHTLGGCLLASILVLVVLANTFLVRKLSFFATLRASWARVLVPFFVSLGLLLWLTRPWLHDFFKIPGGPQNFRSLKSGFEIAYAFYPYILAMGFLYYRKAKAEALTLLAVFVYAMVAGRLLDFYPFSQPRYYLALPIFFLFWPLAVNWPKSVRPSIPSLIVAYAVILLLPEFQGVIRPFQGLRVVVADWRMQIAGTVQPLTEAIGLIKKVDDRGAVLIDYVPQYVNWYLRDRQVALIPDSFSKTPLNKDRNVWSTQLIEPEWHIFYTQPHRGPWNCLPACDYQSGEIIESRYELKSGNLGKTFFMCVVKKWPTARLNNSPVKGYPDEAVLPEGKVNTELVLARRCP